MLNKLLINIKIKFIKLRLRTLIKRRFYKNNNQKASSKLLKNFNLDRKIIIYFYKYISILSHKPFDIPLSAKWLIENKDLIIGELHYFPESLNRKLIDLLPKTLEEKNSNPIILDLIKTYFKQSNNWFALSKFTEYLQKYQNQRFFFLDEIFSLQMLLRLILISELSKGIIHIFEYINASIDLKKEDFSLKNAKKINPEYFFYLNQISGNKNFSEIGISYDLIHESREIIKGEKFAQIIINLKRLNETDWDFVFKKISKVDEILSKDPVNIYSQMSSKSRNLYINHIKINSKRYLLSEIDYALGLLSLAENGEDQVTKHIGFYLLDKGATEFELKFGIPEMSIEKEINYIKIVYILLQIIGIIFFSLIILFLTKGILIQRILFTLFSIIPVYLFSRKVLLKFASKIEKQKRLPSLDIKKNLNLEQSTIFCMPAFIKSKEDIQSLIDRLEIIYLANRGNNIYFNLQLDFPDSQTEFCDGEDRLIKELDYSINNINEKYGFADKFSYFLRRRIWSQNQNLWMGWERKRGKVLEFLRALRNQKTNSSYILSFKKIPKFKYMFIVDEDSYLTKNLILDLVGVIDHPLNRPVYSIKEDRIKRGYVIIRTGWGYLFSTKEKSIFSKLLCGANGYNHYSSSSNEIFFNFFGESLFTGKGIIDIDHFLKLTDKRFEDDSIVSHDHIEGMICRVGYSGDGQVFEGYPTNIRSHLLRLHRWIRGDWQIINWLFKRVKDQNGVYQENPISFIDKVKIFDGLMNSLLFPSLFLLTFYISFFPLEEKNLLYLILLIEFFAYDYIFGLLDLIIKLIRKFRIKFFIFDFIALNKFMLKDKLFEFLYFPYIAFLQIDAISKALIRRFITHKNTLEWTTFTIMENKSKINLAYFKLFLPVWLLILIWLLSIYLYNRIDPIITLLIIIWLVAPFLVKIYDIKLKPSL